MGGAIYVSGHLLYNELTTGAGRVAVEDFHFYLVVLRQGSCATQKHLDLVF
jgi:hypothetical protein